MPNSQERNPDELGALWEKPLRDGGMMMSGSITIGNTKVDIVCFQAKKYSDRSPDWRILKSKPREQRPTDDQEAF